MSMFVGKVIEGEYFPSESEFTLKQVKHLETESTLSTSNIMSLIQYLKEQVERKEDCVLTLYDQVPVRLSQQEMELLIDDFIQIQQQLLH